MKEQNETLLSKEEDMSISDITSDSGNLSATAQAVDGEAITMSCGMNSASATTTTTEPEEGEAITPPAPSNGSSTTTTETPDDDTPEGGYDVPPGGENGSSTTTTTDFPNDGDGGPQVTGIEVKVMTEDGTSLSVHSGPSEACAYIGSFADDSIVTLTNDISHNGWYVVYGTTVEGVSINGWCLGDYLHKEIEVAILTDPTLSKITVRAIANAAGRAIGHIENGKYVPIIDKECAIGGAYTWHKVLYKGREGYVIVGNEAPNFDFETRWIRLSSEKELPQNANDPNENYSETQIECILTNIEGLDTSIVSDAHNETFKMVVRYMLYSKLEVAFIAGLLANIIGEGVFGQFEVSNGYPNIRYMDEEYGEKNFYTNNYSNKNITEVNVLAVRDILADLHDRSNGSFTINGDPIGFGLGCIQWTGDRCYSLVKDYYLLYNNQSSSITKEQVEKAETEMLLGELQGDYYYRVYVAWRMDNSISDSQASARAAAQKICEEYIVPGSSTVVSMREKMRGSFINK